MADAKQRILIVDDEPSIQKILRKQLEVAGFEVSVAVDGAAGLAAIQQTRPDLVVLDVSLPKMNGKDVCNAVKQDQDSALAKTPIIMLTANARREDQEAALKQGADGFLTKPFQLDELLKLVKGLLAATGANGSSNTAPAVGASPSTPPAPASQPG